MKTIRALCLGFILLLIPAAAMGELEIAFLDVGQGDASLIVCDGVTMLIDGGTRDNSQYIYSVLHQANIERLDYVVATHPDADHIGGLPGALEACEVGILYSPTWYSEEDAFVVLKNSAIKKDLPFSFPFPGESIPLGSATVTFLGPVRQYGASNNQSIVLRIDYGDTSFLFTGDAESESEADMLAAGMIQHADLLHVGHHGSSSSSTSAFLKEVHPSIAVISVGQGNTYGLPTQDTLWALTKEGAEIYRTDLQGLIIASSDGNMINMVSERTVSDAELSMANGEPTTRVFVEVDTENVAYVGNKKSKRFHYPSCSGVTSMSEKNKVELHSREEAISLGYEPCGQCQP